MAQDTKETWLDLAKAQIAALELDPDLLEVLRAFGGEDAPGPISLDPDATNDATETANLPTRIAHILSTEVDEDQAQMFARRFTSVSKLLQQPPVTPTSSLLRTALYRRANQIVSATTSHTGRALRIRALVDFIWSQSLVLGKYGHKTETSISQYPLLVDMVDTIQYDEFNPGFSHGLLQGESRDFGPVHINILRIAPGAATLRCVDARSSCTTSLEALVQQTSGAVAGISGGFFLYSEPDIAPPSCRTDPVGLLVTDGNIVNPPVFQRGALVQREVSGTNSSSGVGAAVSIEKIGMQGVKVSFVGSTSNDTSATLEELCAVTVGNKGVRCFHRAQCNTVKIGPNETGVAIVGKKVHQLVQGNKDQTDNVSIDVPLAGFVLVLPDSDLPANLKEGCAVAYTLPRLDVPGNNGTSSTIRSAMAGGPVLLTEKGVIECPSELPKEDFYGSAPPITFSQDETFDRNLLPRMGAGVTSDGELILAAIDGRNLDRAIGLTLKGTAELLSALGCVKGLNLDGGSSKRMVIKGKGTVCLHTTEIKSTNTATTQQPVQEAAGNSLEKADAKIKENKEAVSKLSRPVYSAILFLSNKMD